jgi:hypothetical protein
LELSKDEVAMAALQLHAVYGYSTEEIDQKLGWELIAFRDTNDKINHFTAWKKL